ncbi:MAG: succinate dehydrogenase cytochrome b subunit [Saprospiraceae bacterium]|nr:succinate dehydrogenase cytochrome b subunit [Saprospiraceae bacterium]
MNWLLNYFTSSLGRKIMMSLTGLFLCLFLVIHLIGNMQLFIPDDGMAFNTYAYTMAHNPLIQIVGWATKIIILVHAFQGLVLWAKNKAAKGARYATGNGKSSSWASRNMALLGTALLVFLIIHLANFWVKAKFFPEGLEAFTLADGTETENLYALAVKTFENVGIVILYVVGMVALAYHMYHGFQSAFQSLGINHKKYTPAIKWIGIAVFAILIPLLFAAMPVFFYLK